MIFFFNKGYHGDKAALEEPVQLGTVVVWQQDGIKFAGYRQTADGITKEVSDRHTMNTETDITDETYKAMSKAFNSLAFVFGDEQTEMGPSASASSSSKPEKVSLDKSMRALFEEAKRPMQRLHAGGWEVFPGLRQGCLQTPHPGDEKLDGQGRPFGCKEEKC